MSRQTSGKWTVLRLIVGVFALPLTAFVLLLASIQVQHGFDWVHTAAGVPFGIAAYLCWQFVIWGNDALRRRKTASAVLGGTLLGGISASLALMGSAMLMPYSNLGPMVAFLIVGPIGIVAGVFIGRLSI